MELPKRKPMVTPEKARDWYRRYQTGESALRIAKDADYDVRTVKKYIRLLQQEEDSRQARLMVLRDALQRHQDDLLAFVNRLRSAVSGGWVQKAPGLTTDILWRSLRQHLPHSPIWRNIPRLERAEKAYQAALEAVRRRAKREASQRTGLGFTESLNKKGIMPGFADAIVTYLTQVANGGGALIDVPYTITRLEQGAFVALGGYSVFPFAPFSERELEKLKKDLKALMKEGEAWDESRSLAVKAKTLSGVRQRLYTELDQITVRRIVPGHCRYCPC